MKKRITSAVLLVIAIILLIAHCPAKTVRSVEKIQNTEQANPDQIFTVTRIIDGNTLELDNGERVRLIGVDTPESADNPKLLRDAQKAGQDRSEIIKMGKEATELTRKLVEGKKVMLEFDVQERDKYGRLLAYVSYLQYASVTVPVPEHPGAHGIGDVWNMLNAELVRAGYAQVMTIPPNVKYADLFIKLEKEARDNKRGAWDGN